MTKVSKNTWYFRIRNNGFSGTKQPPMDKKINELIDGFVKSDEPIVESFDNLRFFSTYQLAPNFIVDRHLGTIFSPDSTDSRYVI